MEVFNAPVLERHGLGAAFVQDNCSLSRRAGVIRGLHFQRDPHAQAKLVWVVTGSIFDVIVDLRPGSRTRFKWESFILTDERPCMLYIPKGFAHGFCTLKDDTRVFYKVDSPYNPGSEAGIRWDDPDLGIPWPTVSPILSEKDARLPLLRELAGS